MDTRGSSEHAPGGGLLPYWTYVPEKLQYLQNWASKYGLRGLTVSFGQAPPLPSKAELVELGTAYETIARRGNVSAITQWCLSIDPQTPPIEAREEIRGLLLLFEQLGDRGLSPFLDGQVRFIPFDSPLFDWSVLPLALQEWEPWLKKFESLRTEHDLYEYVQNATLEQVRELAALKALIDRNGPSLLAWCEANNVRGNPAKHEAFQAEWLFILADLVKSREAIEG
jgi:hypothetical protein